MFTEPFHVQDDDLELGECPKEREREQAITLL